MAALWLGLGAAAHAVDPSAPFAETRLVPGVIVDQGNYGEDLARGGDLDGDGYDDVLVGNYAYGSVWIFPGGADGVGDVVEVVGPYDYNGFSGAQFGFSLDGAFDANGDGFDDLAVGALWGLGADGGEAVVYYGTAGGLSQTAFDRLSPPLVEGSYNYFGWSIAGAGDLDGDGFDDLVVGATFADAESQYWGSTGAAYVYSGSPTGIDPGSELVLWAADGDAFDKLGKDVEGLGDVDGDGYDDLGVTCSGASINAETYYSCNALYGYQGGHGGVDPAAAVKIVSAAATGDAEVDYRGGFGWWAEGAGDLNGDGFADLAVGSLQDTYLYYGSPDFLVQGAELRIHSDEHGQASPPAGVGDVDGDGYDDLLLGARYGGDAGLLLLFYGGAAGIDDLHPVVVEPHVIEGNNYFGAGVAAAGDVDGDGHADFSAGTDDFYTDKGRIGGAWLYTTVCASYLDADGDGYGDPTQSIDGCDPPAGYVANGRDCDDTRADWYPGAIETCDGADQDCDGVIDDQPPGHEWFRDTDADGYGDSTDVLLACNQPDLTSAVGGDCDDADPAVYPGATEVDGDGVDQDCDGCDWSVAGQATGVDWYVDSDGDGYGDPDTLQNDCNQPSGTTANSEDCDDADPTAFPGAIEVVGDGVDQDCDGADALADEDTAAPTMGGSYAGGCGGCAVGQAGRPPWVAALVLGLLVGGRRRSRHRPPGSREAI